MAAPTLVADTATTYQAVPVNKNVLSNDTTSGTTTVTFKTTTQPAGVTLSNANKTATKVGQGVWTVETNKTITFTPEEDFVGTAAAVKYQVVDDGGTSDTTLTVTVTAALDLSGQTRTEGVTSDGRRYVDVDITGLGLDGSQSLDAASAGLNHVDEAFGGLYSSNASTRFPKLASTAIIRLVGH